MNIKDEWEYKRLCSLLDKQGARGNERVGDFMAEKLFHSGRGGWRGGLKPETPEHLKRQPLNVRLPKWMIDKLKEQGPSLTETVERIVTDALVKMDESNE